MTKNQLVDFRGGQFLANLATAMKRLFILNIIMIAMTSFAQAMCLSYEEGVRRGCARDLSKSCGAKEYAFHDRSCLGDGKNEIIPDILKLAPNQLIHPDYYRLYDVNDIARTIIYRHYLRNEAPYIKEQDVQNPGNDFYGNSLLLVAFEEQRAPDIAKLGFLNQHQVNHTKGCACTAERAQTENAMVGLNLENPYNPNDTSEPNKLRPKYSYFVPTSPIVGSQSQRFYPNYGTVIAILDNGLKKRMTFTNGDSLNQRNNSARKVHTASYLAARPDFNNRWEYYEAQIWGTVEPKDIKGILLGCFDTPSSTTIDTVANAFSDKQIYGCKKVVQDDLVVFLPGQKYTLGRVHLVSAAYNGVDVTETLKKQCHQKTGCSFSGSSILPSGATAKDTDTAEIKYACVTKSAENENSFKVSQFANAASFKINCMNEKESGYKIPQKIKIKSATYGGNISGVSAGNVTDKAAKFCDGKDTCNYKVASKFLGDPAPGKQKSFKLTYECIPQKNKTDGKTFSLDAANAENTVLELKCPIEAK